MDYTNYDYQTLVDELTAKMAETEGWGEGYQSSTGQLLIQLFADSTDALMYMLERRSQEAFISTALLDTSIFAHASELGYRPRRTICNTGTLVVSVSTPAVADIIIPKYSKITYNKGEFDFVTTEQAVIKAGSTSVDVPVKEGELIRRQYSASESSIASTGDIVIGNYFDIDQYSIEVDDNGIKYYDVEETSDSRFNFGSLSYAGSNDRVYDVKYSIEGMRLVFGDNTFGKKPTGIVTVRYVQTKGMTLPITSTVDDFSFEADVLYDTDNIVPKREYEYTITNITPIRGFLTYESVDEIARMAPEFTRANSRAVTASDYEFWGIRSGIGGIMDVNAYGEQESGSLIYNMNNVNMTYITNDEIPLNVEQEVAFREFMDRYKSVTTHIVLEEARKIEAVLNVKFRKESSVPMTTEQTYEKVKEIIDQFFAVGRGSIGGYVQHSELVRHIQEQMVTINGIKYEFTDYVKVNIKPQFKLPLPFPSYDVTVTLEPTYVINEGDVWSVEIDGETISVTVDALDTHAGLVEKMRGEISNQTSLLTAVEEDPQTSVHSIRVRSNYIDTTFVINVAVGDLMAFVSTDKKYKVPTSKIYNRDNVDLMVAGQCSIVDSSENVIFLDDGNGVLVSQIGGNNIGIDYKTGDLVDPYAPDVNETYYFRFQQDEFQNIVVSEDSVIVLSNFADTVADTPLYSTISIV